MTADDMISQRTSFIWLSLSTLNVTMTGFATLFSPYSPFYELAVKITTGKKCTAGSEKLLIFLQQISFC